MKHFAKAALTVALLAGAGAANASVAYDKGGDNEAYLSAYDFTAGKTFILDTGLTYNELLTVYLPDSSKRWSKDLSQDSNWIGFINGANLSAIKFSVTVGDSVDFGAMITSNSALANTDSTIFGLNTAQAIENHAIDIDSGLAVNNAQNVSKLVLDSDPAGLGQHAGADSVWGGWIQDPQASYGQAIGFQLGQLDFSTGGNIATSFNQQWSLGLTGANTVELAAVPLPSAVLMFGSALIGMVGFNRRKASKA